MGVGRWEQGSAASLPASVLGVLLNEDNTKGVRME